MKAQLKKTFATKNVSKINFSEKNVTKRAINNVLLARKDIKI